MPPSASAASAGRSTPAPRRGGWSRSRRRSTGATSLPRAPRPWRWARRRARRSIRRRSYGWSGSWQARAGRSCWRSTASATCASTRSPASTRAWPGGLSRRAARSATSRLASSSSTPTPTAASRSPSTAAAQRRCSASVPATRSDFARRRRGRIAPRGDCSQRREPAGRVVAMLGRPRLHLRSVGSTNARARELAEQGAPHGTLVTASEQTAGRGRQGRSWVTPPGSAIAASVILRSFDELLPLRAGLAVADLAGDSARVKWPNDVWLEGRKVAGILAEARNGGWVVLGIGVNVALDPATLPPGVAEIAGTLGRRPAEIEATLTELLRALEARLEQDPPTILAD